MDEEQSTILFSYCSLPNLRYIEILTDLKFKRIFNNNKYPGKKFKIYVYDYFCYTGMV